MKTAPLPATHPSAYLARDKALIADILNHPPFDLLDISIVNFLRNNITQNESNGFEVTFKSENDKPAFIAQITTGHSPLDLKMASIAMALRAYQSMTGQPAQWHTAHVAPHFNIAAHDYDKWVQKDPFLMSLSVIHRLNASPAQTLETCLTALNKDMDGEKLPITKSVLNNMFTAVHASILHAETSCVLQDEHGRDMQPKSRRPEWLSRFMR